MYSNHQNPIPQLSKDYTPNDSIAIVGGGASGLASAYFLIQAGHDPEQITIYEKNNYLGGHCRSVYLHRVSEEELYVIQDYDMEFEHQHRDIYLRYVDHNGKDQRLKVNGNPEVIPVDTGVCGFSVNYHNFKTILSELQQKEGIPFFEYDYKENVSVAISLKKLILRSDKVLSGYLWRPWLWPSLFRLKKHVQKIVQYCEAKGMTYLRTITIRELLDELRAQSISEDALAFLCTFCQVGSGYADDHFMDISAGYLFSFFMLGNFNHVGKDNITFLYGASVYLYKLVSYLNEQGVSFKKEREDAKHTIYAMQPYQAKVLNDKLPEITSTHSPLYIHCDAFFQGKMGTALTYGKVNEIALATWDLDLMRPNHPDMSAFITFSTPDYEATIDKRLFKQQPVQNMSKLKGNGHNLYEAPLKKVWQHAFISVPAETNRRDIWQNHQSKDNNYYCSSSYLSCMLHENAITSALDVVCMLTGEQEKLLGLGFKTSEYTGEVYEKG